MALTGNFASEISSEIWVKSEDFEIQTPILEIGDPLTTATYVRM